MATAEAWAERWRRRCGRARVLLSALLLAIAALAGPSPLAADEAAWTRVAEGAIVLFRHAHAPGGGDPPGLVLGKCTTQRNLDEAGRQQARTLGAAFKARGIMAGRVLSSEWCRARETADLMFPGQAETAPAFNSFFDDRTRQPAQTAAAREILLAWRGPGPLVVATHHVNILALTGIATGAAEGIVLSNAGGTLTVVGRIRP